jgi:hypothetical protein
VISDALTLLSISSYRQLIINKARKLINQKQADKESIVWLNLFGESPPPVGYKGQVLNNNFRKTKKKKIKDLNLKTETLFDKNRIQLLILPDN